VLLNILRGDVPRLQRCAAAQTGSAGALPRSKPLRLCYEKEIVLYAHFRKLHYFRHPPLPTLHPTRLPTVFFLHPTPRRALPLILPRRPPEVGG
jgi:hypothetical protein